MADAFSLGEKNGILRQHLQDLFAESLFACPFCRNYGGLVAENVHRPAGFPVPSGLKDLGLMLWAAETSQVSTPFVRILH